MLNANLTVYVVESDLYARYAISSYLGWDRRTRVTQKLHNLLALEAELLQTSEAERPDTILLDDSLLVTPEQIQQTFHMIHNTCPADILVLAHQPHEGLAHAVRKAGGKGYLLREEVGLRVSWMVVWAKTQSFVVSQTTAPLYPDGAVLPDSREYPELTDRIRQALMLCVVEGMSAELAADEMGLSPHTIRTYVKEGYSILEARDQTPLPANLSPQEKAFMRLTALELESITERKKKG